MSVVSLSSELDSFALKPVQASVAQTTEVTYKPIASVDQNELEFVIPADNDTHIDLDKNIHSRQADQGGRDGSGQNGFNRRGE